MNFPGGPEVKNPSSNAEDVGSIPGQGTKIPHATCMLQLMRTQCSQTERERETIETQHDTMVAFCTNLATDSSEPLVYKGFVSSKVCSSCRDRRMKWQEEFHFCSRCISFLSLLTDKISYL